MGLSTAGIMIKPKWTGSDEELLRQAGFKVGPALDPILVDDAIGHRFQNVAVVHAESSTVIFDWDMPVRIIEEGDEQALMHLIKLFSSHEVLVFELVSSTGFWGFCYVSYGVIQRRFAGEGNDETYSEGAPLPEEDPQRYLKASELVDDRWKDSIYLGADFVNSMMARFIGGGLEGPASEEVNRLLFETHAQQFARDASDLHVSSVQPEAAGGAENPTPQRTGATVKRSLFQRLFGRAK